MANCRHIIIIPTIIPASNGFEKLLSSVSYLQQYSLHQVQKLVIAAGTQLLTGMTSILREYITHAFLNRISFVDCYTANLIELFIKGTTRCQT